MKATEVHYKDGLIFCFGNESDILFLDFKENRSRVPINVSKLKRPPDRVNVLSELEMLTGGTITTMSRRLKAKLDEVNEVYMRKGLMKDQINFSDPNKVLKLDNIAVIGSKLIYGACRTLNEVVTLHLSSDGVGLVRKLESLISYPNEWKRITSLSVKGNNMFIVHSNGIELLSLESLFCTHIVTVASRLKPRYATLLENNFLFTCNGKHNLYSWSLDTKETSIFAGSGSEGSRDGTAKHCQFYELTGVAVEFDHNIYVCDFRSSSFLLL